VRRPNIILIVLDTVRADRCCPYGYTRPTTPFLESLAESGTLFADAISNSPWTLPSHATMFTGLLPSQHGCDENSRRLGATPPILADILRHCGYFTVAVSCNTWVSPSFGFGRGFDVFFKPWQFWQSHHDLTRRYVLEQVPLQAILRYLVQNPLVNAVNGFYGRYLYKARDKGARRANPFIRRSLRSWPEPFFLFVNFLEAHLPYRPPRWLSYPWLGSADLREGRHLNQDPWSYVVREREMDEREITLLGKLYDAEVTYVDRQVEELVGTLSVAGLLDSSVMLVTSDHGENLGEQHLMDHQFSVDQTLLRVPLVLRYPGRADNRGTVIDAPVDLRQIPSTLLALAGKRDPAAFPEPPLWDTDPGRIRVAEYKRPVYWLQRLAELFPDADLTPLDRSLRATLVDGYKVVEDSQEGVQLFDLSADPVELSDISALQPVRLQAIRKASGLSPLRDEAREGADPGPKNKAVPLEEVDERLKRRLRDLGYLE